MRGKLRRSESLLWLFIKVCLYIILMAIFMLSLGRENPALIRLSRTMGITISTFVVVGLLFVSIYGKYDVGRRKSKPIVFSMALAVLFTDIISYAQLMIMNTITPSVYAFRFVSVKALFVAMGIQLIVIICFAYAGNALFFKIHKPEKCYIVTSSQENLDAILRGILKYRKQYSVEGVFDYKEKDLACKFVDADTVFLYYIPIPQRCDLTYYCY